MIMTRKKANRLIKEAYDEGLGKGFYEGYKEGYEDKYKTVEVCTSEDKVREFIDKINDESKRYYPRYSMKP